MKFDYTYIKENLRIYNEAKSKIQIISDYERGDVTYHSMRSIGLDLFAEFANFLRDCKHQNWEPISAISYRELKGHITQHTHYPRFISLIKNKSQKSFIKMIGEQPDVFDRLLNGRWITKPGYNYRGKRRWGRRSDERCEGLETAFVPLINWIISNDIEVSNLTTDSYKKFSEQEKLHTQMRWYKSVLLDLNTIPQKEIEITREVMASIINLISETKIDFRKLNSDLILDGIKVKIFELMSIAPETLVRSVVDEVTAYGTRRLTKGKDYKVILSTVNNGFLRVQVEDDSGAKTWQDYGKFEDKSVDRDLLLEQLGII